MVKLTIDFIALLTTNADAKRAIITTIRAIISISLYIFPEPKAHSDAFVVVSAANNNVFINFNFYAMIGRYPFPIPRRQKEYLSCDRCDLFSSRTTYRPRAQRIQ